MYCFFNAWDATTTTAINTTTVSFFRSSISKSGSVVCIWQLLTINISECFVLNELIWEIFDLFSLIKQEDEKSPISQTECDTSKVSPTGCTDSDWWGITDRITHCWQQHPWVNSFSDETPDELWADIRASERNITLNLYLNVFRKWQKLWCGEWEYLYSNCRYLLRWTCALRYADTLQLAPTGHFISVVKNSLKSPSLTAPCTATSVQQPLWLWKDKEMVHIY